MNRTAAIVGGIACGLLALGAAAEDVDAVSFARASDWNVDNFTGKLKIVFGQEVDGVKSLCISGSTVKCDTAWRATSRKIPLAQGARGFRLALEGRCDEDMLGTRPAHGYRNAVFWYDASGVELGMGPLPFQFAKGGFKSLYATGPIPAGARFASVQFGFDSPNIGPGQSLVYRDFVFETFDWELKSAGSGLDGADRRAPRVYVASPTPTTDANTVLKLGVEDESGVDWASLGIEVDGREATAAFTREGDRLVLGGRAEPWTNGLHRVRYRVADTKGNAATNTVVFLIGEAPKTPKATLRDDGIALIDGQPFFPIGIYAVCKREFNGKDFDKAFKDLKKAGFNFAHTYGNSYDPEFLAAAEKYGFKLWVAARVPSKNFVETGRHHPSILAWYLGDDTSMHQTPAELRSYRDAVTAVDPTRLTCQADVVGAAGTLHLPYRDYLDGTDVIMPEIYPIGGKAGNASDTNCVARTIANMAAFNDAIAKSKDGPKANWPILQYFQGWNSWQHFPSREQLFATSFAAIIHGAHGITWYTYGGFYNKRRDYYDEGITSRPERFQNMADLCTWLQELTPALVARACPQPQVEVVSGPRTDPLGQVAVSALLRRANGKAWLLTVNAAYSPVRARFTLADVGAKAEVMREKRTVTLENGVFEDDFAPFAVHIYRIDSTASSASGGN